METELTPAFVCAAFRQFMDSFNPAEATSLMPALELLDQLELKAGYELGVFEMESYKDSIFVAYCHKTDATETYVPTKIVTSRDSAFGRLVERVTGKRLFGGKATGIHQRYDDSMLIEGKLSMKESADVPSHLSYFNVPFTVQGITQAWLLKNISEFMPRRWHYGYGKKHYIFSESDLKRLFPCIDAVTDSLEKERLRIREQIHALDASALTPKVCLTDESNAVLTYCYWNDWSGLVTRNVNCQRQADTIRFEKQRAELLFPFKSRVELWTLAEPEAF